MSICVAGVKFLINGKSPSRIPTGRAGTSSATPKLRITVKGSAAPLAPALLSCMHRKVSWRARHAQGATRENSGRIQYIDLRPMMKLPGVFSERCLPGTARLLLISGSPAPVLQPS